MVHNVTNDLLESGSLGRPVPSFARSHANVMADEQGWTGWVACPAPFLWNRRPRMWQLPTRDTIFKGGCVVNNESDGLFFLVRGL
jgi:hypothetical protein